MIAKTVKLSDVELIMTKNQDGTFNISRIIGNNMSNHVRNLSYEDADDLFDYWLEMHPQNEKTGNEE